MLTKDQIQARFELEVLEPIVKNFEDSNKQITLTIVTKLWFDYIRICYKAGDINKHQYSSWVLPESYKKKFK